VRSEVVPDGEAATGRGPGPGPVPGDPLAGRIAALIDGPVMAAPGGRVAVGADAGFCRNQSVPVSLIESSAALAALHGAPVRIVAELPGRIPTLVGPRGCRPHVSHLRGKPPSRGGTVVLGRIALVDMVPDGAHATRRVLGSGPPDGFP
jgi:hypothetical protein